MLLNITRKKLYIYIILYIYRASGSSSCRAYFPAPASGHQLPEQRISKRIALTDAGAAAQLPPKRFLTPSLVQKMCIWMHLVREKEPFGVGHWFQALIHLHCCKVATSGCP